DQPGGTGVVLLGGCDQRRVEVDADDDVPGPVQVAAGAPRAAAGVEDARPPGRHGVDESGLSVEVRPLCHHLPEALDVPLGVARALGDLLEPAVLRHLVDGTGWPARAGAVPSTAPALRLAGRLLRGEAL